MIRFFTSLFSSLTSHKYKAPFRSMVNQILHRGGKSIGRFIFNQSVEHGTSIAIYPEEIQLNVKRNWFISRTFLVPIEIQGCGSKFKRNFSWKIGSSASLSCSTLKSFLLSPKTLHQFHLTSIHCFCFHFNRAKLITWHGKQHTNCW